LKVLELAVEHFGERRVQQSFYRVLLSMFGHELELVVVAPMMTFLELVEAAPWSRFYFLLRTYGYQGSVVVDPLRVL
jgi:hypothetical protein